MAESKNIDPLTVEGFGKEWAAFDQTEFAGEPYRRAFESYFSVFPFDDLPTGSEGFDLGCGSGRWAAGVAPKVGFLHCIDPAREALAVAKRRLADTPNVDFHLASVSDIPLDDGSQDFGYSLGVLHHIPDTAQAMADCVRKLKPGAPFLVYLYYAMENRPAWFRGIWRTTDVVRKVVCRLPFGARKAVTSVMAGLVYWPLARVSLMVENSGRNPSVIPLSGYRHLGFYAMRTDALDRFGTRLEQRFTRPQIEKMMEAAGLENIRFRETDPFWVAVGYRRDGSDGA
ncbi:class I SAM-dependent methyltransferase [Sphingomonas sabuli]|uniref:Class I SAM-dependent methyltransferase n=1 Tax=Sphingomonas sabuli TaxID=2764186 RepID=A0A7G9L3E4_9SPHN|nr:class I SAM-dependent methyltransferase [Sphingomonas sabuli]QNM83143.1 class I SAM-dependent methyltransferase [Sphingomonas sabuli]